VNISIVAVILKIVYWLSEKQMGRKGRYGCFLLRIDCIIVCIRKYRFELRIIKGKKGK
jgi:hypothetical protein